MAESQLGVRIDARLKKALTAYCRAHGRKIGRFVEDALLDKLEELEDAADLSRLRKEPTRPFGAFVADLKRHGKL